MTILHAMKMAAYMRHAAVVWMLHPLDEYKRHTAMHEHLAFVDDVYAAWGA